MRLSNALASVAAGAETRTACAVAGWRKNKQNNRAKSHLTAFYRTATWHFAHGGNRRYRKTRGGMATNDVMVQASGRLWRGGGRVAAGVRGDCAAGACHVPVRCRAAAVPRRVWLFSPLLPASGLFCLCPPHAFHLCLTLPCACPQPHGACAAYSPALLICITISRMPRMGCLFGGRLLADGAAFTPAKHNDSVRAHCLCITGACRRIHCSGAAAGVRRSTRPLSTCLVRTTPRFLRSSLFNAYAR